MKEIGGFIIEGADQQGKSYVCRKLNEALNYRIHHFSRPSDDTDFMFEYTMPVEQFDVPMIFDRSYVSEIVYGNIFRGGSKVTPEIKEYIEKYFNERNYVMVYLKRKNYKWIDREEMYTEKDNLTVMSMYDDVFPTITIPKIQVDSFDANSIDVILDFYKKNQPSND